MARNAKQLSPEELHAGGYVVIRYSPRSAKGFRRCGSKIYKERDEALRAAVRLDRPDSMTLVDFAVKA